MLRFDKVNIFAVFLTELPNFRYINDFICFLSAKLRILGRPDRFFSKTVFLLFHLNTVVLPTFNFRAISSALTPSAASVCICTLICSRQVVDLEVILKKISVTYEENLGVN